MQRFFDYGSYFDAERVTAARAAYFALCSFMDHNVGLVLDGLEASGQRQNTRVIYTSDHGELLGNRGLWCKSFMFEDSVGVPLIMSGPGIAEGRSVDTNVNLIDLAPTIVDAASLPWSGPGESLVDLANTPTTSRVGFSEYHDGGSITGSFALRVDEWKYIHHEGFPAELYNLVDDPDELHDRSGDHRVAVEQRRCAEILADVVDTTAVDAEAFASQQAIIDRHGGREQLAAAFRFNHTPAPD